MEEAKRKRAAAKGWLRRESEKLHNILVENPVDSIRLQDCVYQFEGRLRSFDEAQVIVESFILDTEHLEADISESAIFRDTQREPFIKAQHHLAKPPDTLPDEASVRLESDSLHSFNPASARLPKLELPKFAGEVTKWTTFWDQFNAVVHDTSLPEITKFSYLQSLLKGEAAAAIKGLASTADNYKTAREILEKRFGRRERIIFGHIQQLLSTSPARHGKGGSLWSLHDELQAHVRSLDTLGVSGDKYGVILTPLLLSRLPPEFRLEWARVGEGREDDLTFLLSFLYEEIRRRERSHTFVDSTAPPSDEKRKYGSASALFLSAGTSKADSNTWKKCVFCKADHFSDRCPSVNDLDLDSRRDKLKELGLCFVCLRASHMARSCKSKCGLCGGHHHRVLCDKNLTHGRRGELGMRTVDKQNDCGRAVQSSSSNSNVLHASGVTSDRDHTIVNQDGKFSYVGVAYANSQLKSTTTVMQTVFSQKGNSRVAILFDSGSDRSFVTLKMARELDLELVGHEYVAYSCFGGSKPSKQVPRNIWKFPLVKGGPDLLLTEIPTICAPMYRTEVPKEHLLMFKDLDFHEDYSKGRHINIDILIGLDYYWQLLKPNIVKSSTGLVAQNTLFGWMLSGTWPSACGGGRGSLAVPSHQFLCLNEVSECMVRKFWELDAIGIKDTCISDTGEDKVLENFSKSISHENGRYIVSLPWKSQTMKGKLMDNEQLARKRLNGLMRKLDQNPELKGEYNKALLDLEKAHIIKEVTPEEKQPGPLNPVFYMPHRPVVKESSQTTKVRPVFDASAVGYNGISLNDCLESGPCLLPDLTAVLLRFRRWKIAFTADVTKAFLQIRVEERDQDVHRFLWDLDGKVRVMKFDRVPFGNTASPFLLNATVQHHLSKYPPSRTVSQLKANLYVDDFLSGADTIEEAQNIIREAKDIMSQASMCLTKWTCSTDQLSEKNFSELDLKHAESEFTKVLGLKWMSSQDCFSFGGLNIPEGLVATKRVVLSFIARLFDPLGFFTPFTMTAKMLFQELWQLGIDWDTEISDSLRLQFEKWLKGIKALQHWRIPRCYVSLSWSAARDPELHIFCDASERGYGCCVYLRVDEGDHFSVSLVLAKARVAPVKRVTLPRLELLAAVLGARILGFVKASLEMPVNFTYKCYTDSMITLGWIQSDANKWKNFVANRVREIQELTDPACWMHCAGSENPADLVTRGMTASALIDSKLWLAGPGWLSSPGNCNQDGSTVATEYEGDSDFREEIEPVIMISHDEPPSLLPVERWSKFSKTVRIVGWILRFCHNIMSNTRSRRTNTDLTLEERREAEITLFRLTQEEHFPLEMKLLKEGKFPLKTSPLNKLNPFLDKDNLMRVKGRLQMSELSYDEKHPIILPRSHISLLMARSQHLLLKHAGVPHMIASLRNRFWIFGLRTTARRVKRECFDCQRLDAGASDEPTAPLPELRVKRSSPFSVTGLDFAGPLYCADHESKKLYFLLFTCGVTRAIHLELVQSLSVYDFMLAFHRFLARRGLPRYIYSDNAKTFVRASIELLQIFGSSSPKWIYNAPRAPWWGGWWERMVRSVKSALKKSISTRTLKRAELETLLIEIEGCLNARPLTFVGDTFDDGHSLTPFHFLIGRSCHLQSVCNPPSKPANGKELEETHFLQQALLDRFWSLWSQDYLRNLPQVRNNGKRGSVQVGSVVLIREDNIPRLCWPLGVVTRLVSGRDGISRTIEVRTNKCTLVRPIQRIHSLELQCPDANDGDCPSNSITPMSESENESAKQGCVELENHKGSDSESEIQELPYEEGWDISKQRERPLVTRSGRKVQPRHVLDI